MGSSAFDFYGEVWISLSLFVIFVGGVLGGYLFERIKVPKLVWHIVLGILVGPPLWHVADETASIAFAVSKANRFGHHPYEAWLVL